MSEPPDGLTEAERVAVLDAGRDTFECRNPECRHDGPDTLTPVVARLLADRRVHYAAALEGAREDVARAINRADDEALAATNFERLGATYDEQATAAIEALAARLGVHDPTTRQGDQ